MIDLDSHAVSPFTVPPMSQADQLSSLPQVRKRLSQPDRPSSPPIATGDLATSLSVGGLGPAPSYETPTYDWRAGETQ